MSSILRDYQRQAITDLITRWDSGATRVPLVLATGLGKTEIFTALESAWIEAPEGRTQSLSEAYGLGRRVLVIAHTDELIDQAARKARMRNPGLSVGIVKAGQNEAHAQIVVSSRQTLASEKRRNAIRNVGLIIVDECHHAVRTNTYGRILEHFGAWGTHDGTNYLPGWEPRVKVAGFTATLVRGDKTKLSSVWEECTFRRDILFGIRRGYLLDVSGTRVIVPDLNLGNVRKSGGDYRDDDLAEELERTFAPQIIAEKYAEVARGFPPVGSDQPGELRKGIAFWPLVETAYHGAEAFEEAGIPSAVIHGALPKEERKLILKRFHAGDIRVVHNCMVLTEGFDEPSADVVVVARPTKSAGLYQQMVGRVLRPDLTVPAEERGKALILDVTGAGAQHDLCSLIDLSPERPLRRDEDDEDLSLLELEEMFEQKAEEFADPTYVAPYQGETAVQAFDPLHRERLWASTPDGTFYMSAGGDAYVFLFEREPAQWDVVWCSKRGGTRSMPGSAGLTDYQLLPLEEALGWAEEEAITRGGVGTKTLTARTARWRKEAATSGQISTARGMGLPLAASDGRPLTKGEMSEAIDKVHAARRIDPLVRTVRARLQAPSLPL